MPTRRTFSVFSPTTYSTSTTSSSSGGGGWPSSSSPALPSSTGSSRSSSPNLEGEFYFETLEDATTNFSIVRMRLEAIFATLGVDNGSLEKVDKMNLSTSQTFLLTRLVGNLKGSQVSKLFDALDNEGQIQDHHNGEEGQALINQQENTEMTSIFVPKTA